MFGPSDLILNLSASKSGDGAGLSECRRILETFNGTIEVHSEVNVGSTFTILLTAMFKGSPL